MFVFVILRPNRNKIVIPISWIYSIDIVQAMNRGISKTKEHKVFFSTDIFEDPNFRLPVRNDFDGTTGCFLGHVMATFRKCQFCYF